MVKGYKTTEFYVTVLTDIGLVAASIGGVLPPKWAAVAAGVAQAAYAISRGLTKNGLTTQVPPAA